MVEVGDVQPFPGRLPGESRGWAVDHDLKRIAEVATREDKGQLHINALSLSSYGFRFPNMLSTHGQMFY